MSELTDWLEALEPILARLRDFELPQEFSFDYSTESLDELESILLERFSPGSAPAVDTGFAESAVAYVGEALMRVTGGSWEWRDEPQVRPDDALGLPPISPQQLLVEAVRARTATVLRGTHARLQQDVKTHQASHPGWLPTKVPTPGVDEVPRRPDEYLVRWLADREAVFPRWVADYGREHVWDFSPRGYDDVEAVLRSGLSSAEDADKPEHAELVQGAAWYLGEIARRNAPHVTWEYNPVVPGSSELTNPWVGRPYVSQEDGDAVVPIHAIEDAVDEPEPGLLRRRFADLR